jgi:hypothetical protein
LQIQNRWERKGNHCCEGGNTVVPILLPFPVLLHLNKFLTGLKFYEDEEAQKEIATWLRAQAAQFCDTGIQTLVPRLNKCPDKGGDYVDK